MKDDSTTITLAPMKEKISRKTVSKEDMNFLTFVSSTMDDKCSFGDKCGEDEISCQLKSRASCDEYVLSTFSRDTI